MSLKDLFRRKSVEQLQAEPAEHEGPKLNRVLTAKDVFSHGVAAIIGTGIFVLTGVAAANFAGPGIILSFILAGLACAFVSFAYAELSSMIPVSGSAYTYTYAFFGELAAFLIGWDLLLEYAVGSSAVAVGWSAYLQNVLRSVGVSLPDSLSHAPADMPWMAVIVAVGCTLVGFFGALKSYTALRSAASVVDATRASRTRSIVTGVGSLLLCGLGLFKGYEVATHLTSIDLPAVLIIAFLNFWLIKGVNHTAKMTAVFVVIKLAVVALFIGVGIWHIQPTNYVPFLPFGFSGVLSGAAIVFFAYIGFDAVTTLAEECKDPQRDVPKGVIGSLIVCTVLYILVAAIMTGAMVYTALGGSEAAAPMAKVMEHIGHGWAVPLVSLGAIAGITSVLIVLLFGQSRIMMRMSKDGLLSPVFGKIHEKYRTPVWSIVIWGVLIAIMAGLLPINELAELTNIGTLAAFVLVCVGVIVLRKSDPDRPRKFRCPGYPWVPALGALMSLGLMLSLPALTWIRFVCWMAIGLGVYFVYSRRHSRLRDANNNNKSIKPDDKSDKTGS